MDRFCCDKKNVELPGRYGCIIPREKKYYKKKENLQKLWQKKYLYTS